MNKFWVMIALLIVSAVIGVVIFYYSDTCTYWRFEKKVQSYLDQLGGIPDEFMYEPERTTLRESGYLIEFDKMYFLQDKSDLKLFLNEIDSWDISDVVLWSTFSCNVEESNANIVRIRFWVHAKLAARIEYEIIKSGLIPHAASQQ